MWEAVLSHDGNFLKEMARNQAEKEADYLDLNVAVGKGDQQEVSDMDWAIKTVQEAVDIPVAIDTTNKLALEAGLKAHRGNALINSISAEPGRLEPFLELAVTFNSRVIALPVKDKIPDTSKERLSVCEEILRCAVDMGLSVKDVYFDPLVMPLSVDVSHPRVALETLEGIKSLSEAGSVVGLSNISFGLPGRSLLNKTFLVMAMGAGLDAVILNPLEKEIIAMIKATQALLGYDELCMKYIKAFRQGKLG